MIDELELKELVENFKFKNDGVYDCFEYLLDSERVQDPDAITLIKFAIEHEIEALSEEEMRIIGIDILKNNAFVFICDKCQESLSFEDMRAVLEITRDKHEKCYQEMEDAFN
ncbi:TPA: hypothetical protein QCX17_005668 [Bacillus cereus]|uniref:hypothetical protein n=2 Tax=Bacillus TaxID=1386 RepID=UPI0009953C48|nr:hypothetical protein [Bacillus cereus]MCI4059677.1 hypothetical protein [Bacillus cereus]MDZ4434593.1 hypothetical protein [Bacillus cereus]MDZ4448464.1 hypothetical protein [Bacillus cereus]MDZ4614655.1 hypothetical protein [Bacillus cereus]OPA32929.1 hypothetical protein BHL47_02880 [Bacillus cereus]